MNHNIFKANVGILLLLTFISWKILLFHLNEGIEGCYGVASGLLLITGYGLGLAFLLAGLIRWRFSKDESQKRKDTFLFICLLFPLIISMQGIFGFGKKPEAKVIEEAIDGWKYSMVLRQDMSYTLHIVDIEVHCYHSGIYEIKGDTLRLFNLHEEKFVEHFSEEYLIRKMNYIPMDGSPKVDTLQSTMDFPF